MIRPADRRTVLRHAAVAALFPLAAQIPASPLAAAGRRFVPPSGPMRYTRCLTRNLAGGARFRVERSFAVHFTPTAQGCTVTGDQLAVEVEAPEVLAAFARMERERVETGLFPLTLDPWGQITGGPDLAGSLDLREAVQTARTLISRSTRGIPDKTQMLAFVSALHQSAAQLTTALPADLFVPVDIPRLQQSEVPLPDGEQGEVTASFTARTDPATGLMVTAERKVITAIAGDRRETVESWTLSPL